MTPSGTKRIGYIDALRGFTMFLVVVMHVGAMCFGPPAPSFHSILKLIRMPMFFLVSGFVFYKAVFFFLAMLGLRCCTGFSLIAASGGYSLVAVCGLLVVVASLVAEHRL